MTASPFDITKSWRQFVREAKDSLEEDKKQGKQYCFVEWQDERYTKGLFKDVRVSLRDFFMTHIYMQPDLAIKTEAVYVKYAIERAKRTRQLFAEMGIVQNAYGWFHLDKKRDLFQKATFPTYYWARSGYFMNSYLAVFLIKHGVLNRTNGIRQHVALATNRKTTWSILFEEDTLREQGLPIPPRERLTLNRKRYYYNDLAFEEVLR